MTYMKAIISGQLLPSFGFCEGERMLLAVEQVRESRQRPCQIPNGSSEKVGAFLPVRSVLCSWDVGSLYRMPACPCSSRELPHQGGRRKDQVVAQPLSGESSGEEGLNLLGQGWRLNTGRTGPKEKLVTKNTSLPPPREPMFKKVSSYLLGRKRHFCLARCVYIG